MPMARVLVIHGPNLNLLGSREPEIYGRESLEDLNRRLREEAARLGLEVEILQSNHEGEIVEAIQGARGEVACIVINPAAFTHYSLAIREAIAASGVPAIEVHLSNIYAREGFRRRSVVAPVAVGQITGLGSLGYLLALQAAVHLAGTGRAVKA